MISCVRRIQFCAGHRVYQHEGKCAHMHGHNYIAYFHARASKFRSDAGVDKLGRVVDFGVLKDKVGGWIEDHWDHGFIYFEDDQQVRYALGEVQECKSFKLMVNPTAENMANYLLHYVCPQLLEGVQPSIEVFKVVLWETENCFAEATLDD